MSTTGEKNAFKGFQTNSSGNQTTTYSGNQCVTVHHTSNGSVVHHSYQSENLARRVSNQLNSNGISAFTHEKW